MIWEDEDSDEAQRNRKIDNLRKEVAAIKKRMLADKRVERDRVLEEAAQMAELFCEFDVAAAIRRLKI